MKVSEIIQRVQSLYSRGVPSDNTELSPRHIYSKLVSLRAMLLLQKAKKKDKISSWSFQTLNCVQVIPVTLSECPCLPIVSTCQVMRTKYQLPKPISGILGSNIEYIMSLDGQIKFDESNKTEMLHIKGNKYTSDKYRFVIDNGYAYLYGRNIPKILQVRMLCEDPLEALRFLQCDTCEECLDPYEVEFPIETGYIDTIIELASKELVEFFRTSKEDNKNDSKEE